MHMYSKNGDKIQIDPDQVKTLKDAGWTDSPPKKAEVKVKAPVVEVEAAETVEVEQPETDVDSVEEVPKPAKIAKKRIKK